MLYLLILSFLLFLLGSFGMFITKRHIIVILISLEIIILVINFNFVLFGIVLDDFFGFAFSLVVMTTGAVESAIGLAIFIAYYRLRGGLSIDLISLLKA